jgi:hypothetical protein
VGVINHDYDIEFFCEFDKLRQLDYVPLHAEDPVCDQQL